MPAVCAYACVEREGGRKGRGGEEGKEGGWDRRKKEREGEGKG